MKIDINIQDLDKVAARFKKTGDALGATMTIPATEAMADLKRGVPPYPPMLPRQKYKRTGILGASFETDIKPLQRGVTMRFSNNAIQKGKRYAGWVISTERFGKVGPQAQIHQGRWYTMQKYTQGKIPDILKIFHAWVKTILSNP